MSGSLLNKKAVRQYLLDEAKVQHPHKAYTRVSEEALDDIEARLRLACQGYVRQQRVGKTISRP